MGLGVHAVAAKHWPQSVRVRPRTKALRVMPLASAAAFSWARSGPVTRTFTKWSDLTSLRGGLIAAPFLVLKREKERTEGETATGGSYLVSFLPFELSYSVVACCAHKTSTHAGQGVDHRRCPLRGRIRARRVDTVNRVHPVNY